MKQKKPLVKTNGWMPLNRLPQTEPTHTHSQSQQEKDTKVCIEQKHQHDSGPNGKQSVDSGGMRRRFASDRKRSQVWDWLPWCAQSQHSRGGGTVVQGDARRPQKDWLYKQVTLKFGFIYVGQVFLIVTLQFQRSSWRWEIKEAATSVGEQHRRAETLKPVLEYRTMSKGHNVTLCLW